MRVILPPDLRILADKVRPYVIDDDLGLAFSGLSPDAPPHIVEMYNKIMEYYDSQYKKNEELQLWEIEHNSST